MNEYVKCKSEIYEHGMNKMDFTVGNLYLVTFKSEYECGIVDDFDYAQWFTHEEVERFFEYE